MTPTTQPSLTTLPPPFLHVLFTHTQCTQHARQRDQARARAGRRCARQRRRRRQPLGRARRSSLQKPLTTHSTHAHTHTHREQTQPVHARQRGAAPCRRHAPSYPSSRPLALLPPQPHPPSSPLFLGRLGRQLDVAVKPASTRKPNPQYATAALACTHARTSVPTRRRSSHRAPCSQKTAQRIAGSGSHAVQAAVPGRPRHGREEARQPPVRQWPCARGCCVPPAAPPLHRPRPTSPQPSLPPTPTSWLAPCASSAHATGFGAPNATTTCAGSTMRAGPQTREWQRPPAPSLTPCHRQAHPLPNVCRRRDYLFFRNNVPDIKRLAARTAVCSGTCLCAHPLPVPPLAPWLTNDGRDASGPLRRPGVCMPVRVEECDRARARRGIDKMGLWKTYGRAVAPRGRPLLSFSRPWAGRCPMAPPCSYSSALFLLLRRLFPRLDCRCLRNFGTLHHYRECGKANAIRGLMFPAA